MADASLLHDLQISATNQLVEALVISENRMRQRLDLLTEVVFELDESGRLVFINKAWQSLMGTPAAQLLGKNFRKHLRQEDWPVFDLALSHADKEPEARRTTIRFVRDTGAILWMELSIARIATGHVGALHDVTEQRRIQDQLEYIAHYDVLTKMPNRALLSDRLNQALASCQRHHRSLAVAFLDLDGFKLVNDAHGHDIGDQLLMTMAKRMKAALRDGDSIARLGGDEFVAVLVDLDDDRHAEPVLQRLLQAASDPVELGALSLQVSASIGVTMYPQDCADADQLIRHADQAMYIAKQSGKNRFHFFDVANDSAARAHGETLDRVLKALDQGEFVLHYQPKLNMRTNQVFGVEALIRWMHPEKGLLPPAAFLPIMENQPVSVQVGEWVISTALKQLELWRATGLDLEMSVNVGAHQLLQGNFAQRVSHLLAEHPRVQPSKLTLEILETSALGDTEQVSRLIRTCQAMGIGFALDDFGTGYSSLTYLKHLPAETLKIDRSFVRDMLTDRDDLAIVKGVIALARAFKRKVIAEGVETQAHMQRLRRLGCEGAQGFGIARAMPANEVPGWLAAWSAQAAKP